MSPTLFRYGYGLPKRGDDINHVLRGQLAMVYNHAWGSLIID